MTCCVLRTQAEEQESSEADTTPAMGALLSALLRRDEQSGRAWVVHVAGPADEVATVVREAHHEVAYARGPSGAPGEPGHATFVLQARDRSASQLIGVDRGVDRVMALLGVRADRANFVVTALEDGNDIDAVASADVLITQQPRLGRTTVARRPPPSGAAEPAALGRSGPRGLGAAALQLPATRAARGPAPHAPSAGSWVPALHAAVAGPAEPRRAARPRRQSQSRAALVICGGAALVIALAAAGILLLPRAAPSRPPAVQVAPRPSVPPGGAPAPLADTAFPGIPVGSPQPVGRSGAAVAVDGARRTVMLFGGSGADGRALGDTWTFTGTSWSQPALRRAPPARTGAVATWDPSIHMVVVFGGIGATGNPLSDTWIWDGRVWQNLLPTRARPPAGLAAGVTFDTARQELVLVTAGAGEGATSPVVEGQTWTWAGTTWGRLTTPTSPLLSGPATVTYDQSAAETILVDVRSNTTWSFDGTTWTRHPPDGLALVPTASTHAAYDAAAGAVILVQDAQPGTVGATWTFDGVSWSRSRASGAPPQTGSLTPDPLTNGVLALSGATTGANLDLRSHLLRGGWGPIPAINGGEVGDRRSR